METALYRRAVPLFFLIFLLCDKAEPELTAGYRSRGESRISVIRTLSFSLQNELVAYIKVFHYRGKFGNRGNTLIFSAVHGYFCNNIVRFKTRGCGESAVGNRSDEYIRSAHLRLFGNGKAEFLFTAGNTAVVCGRRGR